MFRAIDKCTDINTGGFGYGGQTFDLEGKCNNNGHVIKDIFNDYYWYETAMNGRNNKYEKVLDCYSSGSNSEIYVIKKLYFF